MDKLEALAFGCVVGLLLGMLWGIFAAHPNGRDAVRREAIREGHAERVIVDPESGETEFRWKAPPPRATGEGGRG